MGSEATTAAAPLPEKDQSAGGRRETRQARELGRDTEQDAEVLVT